MESEIKVVPWTNTKNPSKSGSQIFPVVLAKQCAPTPRAQASNVASALFKPFPSVAPKNGLNESKS